MPKASKKRQTNKKSTPVIKLTPVQVQSLSSAVQLFRISLRTLWEHKKLFSGVLVIVGLVQLMVVQGLIRSDFLAVRGELQQTLGSELFGIGSGVASYVYLLGSSNQSSGTGLLQVIFFAITILAVVWVLRELAAGTQPRIRDAFYKSTYPLIPFLLVSFWLAIQLVPALIGAWLYTVIMVNNIAVHAVEQLVWLLLLIALIVLSVRLVVDAVFALVIATLPDMTPWAAIRSAKQLVVGKRVAIVGKLLFLGVALLIAMTVVVLPAILFIPVIVPMLFYAVSLAALAVAVIYVYTLYKELLQ